MSKILDLYDSKDRKGLEKYYKEEKLLTLLLSIELIAMFILAVVALTINSIHQDYNQDLLVNIGKTYCKDKGMSYYNSVQVQGIFKTTGFRVSCFDTTGLKAFTLYQKG